MIFHCHVNKTHFHKKGWAPNLVLIQRPWGTRKWPHIYMGVEPSVNRFFFCSNEHVLLMICLFCKEMIGGSLKIYWSYSWFCIRFHFFIQASFIVDTEGWYCVTNGNISFSSLLFCFRSLESLLWILFLIVGFLSKIVGSLRPSNVFFKIWIIFLKGFFWKVFFVGFSRLLLWQILF